MATVTEEERRPMTDLSSILQHFFKQRTQRPITAGEQRNLGITPSQGMAAMKTVRKNQYQEVLSAEERYNRQTPVYEQILQLVPQGPQRIIRKAREIERNRLDIAHKAVIAAMRTQADVLASLAAAPAAAATSQVAPLEVWGPLAAQRAAAAAPAATPAGGTQPRSPDTAKLVGLLKANLPTVPVTPQGQAAETGANTPAALRILTTTEDFKAQLEQLRQRWVDKIRIRKQEGESDKDTFDRAKQVLESELERHGVERVALTDTCLAIVSLESVLVYRMDDLQFANYANAFRFPTLHVNDIALCDVGEVTYLAVACDNITHRYKLTWRGSTYDSEKYNALPGSNHVVIRVIGEETMLATAMLATVDDDKALRIRPITGRQTKYLIPLDHTATCVDMLDCGNGAMATAVGMENGAILISRDNPELDTTIYPLAAELEDEGKDAAQDEEQQLAVRTVALTITDNQKLVCTSTFQRSDRYYTWSEDAPKVKTGRPGSQASDLFALKGGNNEIVECSSAELRFDRNVYVWDFTNGLTGAAISPSTKRVAVIVRRKVGHGRLHMFNTEALVRTAPSSAVSLRKQPFKARRAAEPITGEADGAGWVERTVNVKLTSTGAFITTVRAPYNPAENRGLFWDRVKTAISEKIDIEKNRFITSNKMFNEGGEPELSIAPRRRNAEQFYQKLAEKVAFTRRGNPDRQQRAEARHVRRLGIIRKI